MPKLKKKVETVPEEATFAGPPPSDPTLAGEVEMTPEAFTLASYKHVNGFTLENDDKLFRTVFGEMGRAGVQEGGVGEGADPYTVLVAYDRKGGLITKDGVKVMSGAFWDSKTKKPRAEPLVVLEYNVQGNFIRVSDPSELPGKILEMNGVDAKKQADFAKRTKGRQIPQ